MAKRSSLLTGAEPAGFWEHFEAITRIARPSHEEQAIIGHVRAWAAERGLTVRQDERGNLAVLVPPTPGRERAETVILQGHLDMVCERRPGSPNDAAEGRIELVLDGEWLTADGTTLGADDGVAIAVMMALAEDPSLPHGPLELLMTVAEEVGLEGANQLDGSILTGSVLLNLDSEEDGMLTVGCAGSTDTWIRIRRPRGAVDEDDVALSVVVSGGLGGHSGSDIARGRSNAIKVLGGALRTAGAAGVPVRLVSLDGGRSRNAIPRDAVAVVAVPRDGAEAFRNAVEDAARVIRDAFLHTDPALTVSVDEAPPATDAWSRGDSAVLLDAVAVIPTGPLAMSPDFDGVVETSTSLGEAITDREQLTLHSLSRSSNDPALSEMMATLDAIARLADGQLEVKVNHGAWRPNLDSAALAAASRVFVRAFGREPIVTATHAGLEPAVIGSRVAGLDMVSLGPEIQFPHSPDERLCVPSVDRFWTLLAGVVDELSRPG